VSKFAKAGLLSLLIFGFFVLMSRIDYIVNATLYEFGLRFSYVWANDYWITYNAIFVMFAVMIAVVYWIGSKKTRSDLKVSAALFVTVNLLTLGGLQDIMFFLLWGGGLPSINVVWWWAPWTIITGTWNSMIQVGFTTLTACMSAIAWIMALKKQKSNIS
jgi:hypothetical protein